MTKVQPTSGKEWRRKREEGSLVQLPSGNIVRMRTYTSYSMLEMGVVPDSLTPIMQEIALGKRSELPLDEWQSVQDFVAMQRNVVKAVFIAPRVVDNPQSDDEISIEDVEQDDISWVWEQMNAPMRSLERFHPEYKSRMELVAGESDDVPRAQRNRANSSVDRAEIPV